MRKRRILSLLLAVAVTATMLIAVPLTASANYSDTDNLITWDFGEYTVQQDLQPTGDNRVDTAPTLEYRGLTIYGNTKGPGTNSNDGSDKAISDYVSTNGFHGNGASSTSTRYITYKPTNNGTLTVYFSNNGTSSARWVGVAKNSVKLNTEDPDIIAYGYSVNPPDGESVKTSIEAKDLTAGTEYYIFFGAGAQTISKITYAYTSSGTEPGPGGGDGDEVTAAGSDTPSKSNINDYFNWNFHVDGNSFSVSDLNTLRESGGAAAKFSTQPSLTTDKTNTSKRTGDTKGLTFDLPHGEHAAHADSDCSVPVYDNATVFTISNILPADCGFDSYDLLFVYNYNGGSARATKIEVKGADSVLIKDYTDSGNNDRDTDPDEVIFGNLTANEIKLSWSESVDIYSISIDYHKAGAAAATKVVTATDITDYSSQRNSKLTIEAYQAPTEDYTNEYKNIFGDNFTNAGKEKIDYLNDSTRYVKTDYTLDQPGNYRIYVLVENARDGNLFTLKKKDGDTTVIEKVKPKASKSVGKINYDLHIYTYDINVSEVGVYEFTFGTDTNASDFIAMAIGPIGITWGSTGTDSGYYMEGDSKLGVIRFFQSVNANDVIDYGFYVVKSDGTIVDSARTNSEEKATELTGIYGDLYGLPNESASDAEAQSTYSMKAFVTLKGSDNPVFAPESIKDQKVNWDVRVTDTIPSE